MNPVETRSPTKTRFHGIQPKTTVFLMVCFTSLCNCVIGIEQTPPDFIKPLVVVACPDDVRLVRLLGRDHLDVQPLFKTEAADANSEYGDCNARVKELVGFSVYLVSADDVHPCEACWRERLTRLNPQGEVIEVPRTRSDLSSSNRNAARLQSLHQVLVSALPQLAKEFDQHLRDEWYRNRTAPLASFNHDPCSPIPRESKLPARVDSNHRIVGDTRQSRAAPVIQRAWV